MATYLFSSIRLSSGTLVRKMIINARNEEDAMQVALRKARQRDARADFDRPTGVIYPLGRSGDEAWSLLPADRRMVS